MPALGIITCQILELEFAHILSRDLDVAGIWVLENEFSQDLIAVLKNDGRKPIRPLAGVDEFAAAGSGGLSILVQVMEVGLHSVIRRLQQGVLEAVEKMAAHVDAVLLGYGLCGNALADADTLFAHVPVPVMLPMDEEGPVDDCVGIIIGGRENYYEEQCRCAGTMFMNAGFSRHWKTIMSADVPAKMAHKKEAILRRLMASYQRSLLLPTPVLGEAELEVNVSEFSRAYGLRTESRPGTLEILEKAWEKAKRVVAAS